MKPARGWAGVVEGLNTGLGERPGRKPGMRARARLSAGGRGVGRMKSGADAGSRRKQSGSVGCFPCRYFKPLALQDKARGVVQIVRQNELIRRRRPGLSSARRRGAGCEWPRTARRPRHDLARIQRRSAGSRGSMAAQSSAGSARSARLPSCLRCLLRPHSHRPRPRRHAGGMGGLDVAQVVADIDAAFDGETGLARAHVAGQGCGLAWAVVSPQTSNGALRVRSRYSTMGRVR